MVQIRRTSTSPSRVRMARFGAAAASVLLAGGALSACSSGGSEGSGSSSSAMSDGADSSQDSGSISSRLDGQSSKSFKATYDMLSGSGTQTITVAQKPPKSSLSTEGSTVITDGSKSIVCSGAGTDVSCISMGSGSANPAAGVMNLIDAKSIASVLKGYESQAAAKIAGVSIEEGSRTFAGIRSTCVTVTTGKTDVGEWCVGDNGVLTYVSSGGSKIELKSYSADVSDADVSVPAGATVESIPGA